MFFAIIYFLSVNVLYSSYSPWCSFQALLPAIDMNNFSYSFYGEGYVIFLVTNTD